jgi:hypothetical protein
MLYKNPIALHKYCMNVRKIFKYFGITVLVVGAVSILAGSVYVSTPYRANETAKKSIESSRVINLDTQKIWFFQTPSKASLNLVLVYPGGRVQPESYGLLCQEFVTRGVDCAIIEMPLNFAFVPHAGIDKVMAKLDQTYVNVIVAGHSLGGPFLVRDLQMINPASYNISTLVLLGSYSDIDFSNSNLSVISVVGSEDKLLGESVDKYKSNLPKSTKFEVIEGGNHAQWGDYGEQDGDGKAAISSRDQKQKLLEILQK